MTNKDKIEMLKTLDADKNYNEEYYYETLEQMGDLKTNYRDYAVTEPINCDKELERLDDGNYELCTALLTMLLREDHFSNGSFQRRCREGQVQPIINRMISLL